MADCGKCVPWSPRGATHKQAASNLGIKLMIIHVHVHEASLDEASGPELLCCSLSFLSTINKSYITTNLEHSHSQSNR